MSWTAQRKDLNNFYKPTSIDSLIDIK